MEKALDDLEVKHISHQDTHVVSDMSKLNPEHPYPWPDEEVDVTDVVTVDIKNPNFIDIVKNLWCLQRIPEPVNQSEQPLHEMIYQSPKFELRTFERNPNFNGGERGLFATGPIAPEEAIFIERGFIFPAGQGYYAAGTAVALDAEFSQNLSMANTTLIASEMISPFRCFTAKQWRESCVKGLFSTTEVGHSILGEGRPEKHGTFAKLSMLNHSCTPNACFSFDSDGDVHVYALQDIMPDEEITVRYTHLHGHLNNEETRSFDENFSWACNCGKTVEERKGLCLAEIQFAKTCIIKHSNEYKPTQ